MIGAFLFFALVLVVVGGVELARAMRRERNRYHPDVREVSGNVAADELLTSPLAGEPCVWYRLEISQYGSAAGTQGSYSVVHEEKKGTTFEIEREGADRTRVDPEHAELLDAERRTTADISPFRDDPPPEVPALVEARGLPLQRENGEPYSYSLVEERLGPGQVVHARGLLRDVAGGRVLAAQGADHPLVLAHVPPSSIADRNIRHAVTVIVVGVLLAAAPFVHRWLTR